MMNTNKFFTAYRSGIRTSLRNNAAAYGYSIVTTANFATLHHMTASPDLLKIYSFIIGAVAAFAMLEMITSQMYRQKSRGEPSDVVALGTAFSIFSISAAVGVTALVAQLLEGWVAWLASAFASTVAYLILLGFELALADRAARQANKAE